MTFVCRSAEAKAAFGIGLVAQVGLCSDDNSPVWYPSMRVGLTFFEAAVSVGGLVEKIKPPLTVGRAGFGMKSSTQLFFVDGILSRLISGPLTNACGRRDAGYSLLWLGHDENVEKQSEIDRYRIGLNHACGGDYILDVGGIVFYGIQTLVGMSLGDLGYDAPPEGAPPRYKTGNWMYKKVE